MFQQLIKSINSVFFELHTHLASDVDKGVPGYGVTTEQFKVLQSTLSVGVVELVLKKKEGKEVNFGINVTKKAKKCEWAKSSNSDVPPQWSKLLSLLDDSVEETDSEHKFPPVHSKY